MRAFSQTRALIAESVLLDSRLALFHEQERWLAVADLHFGYELSQRVAGRLVPFWGMESIETRLRQLVCDYNPATLILLGDLVHDKAAAHGENAGKIQQPDSCTSAGNFNRNPAPSCNVAAG